ncbi:CrpP-related protein [Novosphingobium chloroacetimidivorans]
MLVSAGASAAAIGLSQLDNPFLDESEFPRMTGEPISTWANKVIAWDEGWKIARRIAADLDLRAHLTASRPDEAIPVIEPIVSAVQQCRLGEAA